jgi:hypothetical protein
MAVREALDNPQGCLKVLPRGLASLPLHRQDSPQPRLDRLGTQPHLSLASSGVQLSGSPGTTLESTHA